MAPALPHALLGEEDWTAVTEEIDHGDDRYGDQQENEADGAGDDVNQALDPRVAWRVDLLDVEHQGDPLQFGDRELSEPFVVEMRQSADAHTPPVQECRLGDEPFVRRCLPAEHDEVGMCFAGHVDERTRRSRNVREDRA